MRFNTYFKTASFLLVLSAFLSLALTGELETPYIVIFSIGIAAGLFQERLDLSFLSKTILTLSIPFLAVDFFYISLDILPSFTHLLILLTTSRLLSIRTDAEYNQLFLLTFFDLLAASAMTISLSFAFTFTIYLVSVTWVLLLFHVKKEVAERLEKGGYNDIEGTVTLPLFLGIGGVAVLSLIITLGIFFILPRMGVGLFSKKESKVLKSTGFGDKVDLGGIGPLTPDTTTVMRVELPDFEKGLETIYLRGTVLNSFNGKSWKRERSKLKAVENYFGDFEISKSPNKLVRQEIILDPLDSRVLFGMPQVVRFTGAFRSLVEDNFNSIYLPVNPSSRFQYTVYSDTKRPTAKELASDSASYGPDAVRLFTGLPPLPDRIRDLASSITSTEKETYGKAKSIQDYLQRNYSYNLSPKRDPSIPPMEDFLFNHKEGYCDHFSTAMAVLLREVGIPSRLVTGYMTWEWNSLGRFYTVRQNHAHSWVEVLFPSYGWVSFDPTPSVTPVNQRDTASAISRYVSYIRLKWDRYIISFSLQDQVNAAKEARKRTELGRETLLRLLAKTKLKTGSLWRPLGFLFAALFILYLSLKWMRRIRRAGYNLRGKGSVPFYQEMLETLERKGLVKPDGMTPREFAREVTSKRGELYDSVLEVTDAFERVRYGGVALTKDEMEHIVKRIEVLRRMTYTR